MIRFFQEDSTIARDLSVLDREKKFYVDLGLVLTFTIYCEGEDRLDVAEVLGKLPKKGTPELRTRY